MTTGTGFKFHRALHRALIDERKNGMDKIETLRAEVERLSSQTSWIVGNGDGTKWRCWRDGFSRWTINRDEATRYARREDAEAVHAEDEDAWRVEQFVSENPLFAERDAAIARAEKLEAALWPFARIKMVPYSIMASDEASIELSGFELIDGKAFIKASAFRAALTSLTEGE